MWSRPLIVLMLALSTAVASSRSVGAQVSTRDSVVYVFWAENCPHSARAMTFIVGLRKTQPTWQIRDYEVERSSANAAAHARVLDRIGISGISLVPLIVVGEYAHIGFEGNETSGKSILGAIDRCRRDGCPDRIGDLIAEPTQPWTAATTLAPVAPRAKAACTDRVEIRTIAPAAQ